MRVFLLQDIAGVGQRGDVKEVKDGYAQNYLIPRLLAKFASDSVVTEAKRLQRRKITQSTTETKDIKRALKELNGKNVALTEKANEQGHLFALIHEDAVARAILEQHGVVLEPNMITFQEPIKKTGKHKVRVSSGDAKATITVDVKSTG